jgi:hypothetical protein
VPENARTAKRIGEPTRPVGSAEAEKAAPTQLGADPIESLASIPRWAAGSPGALGGGRPLEPEVRADMKTRLGHDFSQVRIHDDSRAHESTATVNANAYTVGSHIVFQTGGYNPATSEGKRTLAHELTHVVQQSQGPVDGTEVPGGIRVSEPSDRFEREAVANAEKAVSAPASATTAGPQRVHVGAEDPSSPVAGYPTRGVVQREPKKTPVVIPPSPTRQAMVKELMDEHKNLNIKVANDAVNGAKRVMGAGGAGGDVVLDEHVTREVSVHTGRLDEQNLTTHLQEEARQTGVREIYLQINSPGATTQSIRQAMNGIQNGIPELAGVRVRVYDSQGRVVWQGNMRFRDTDPIKSRPGGGGGGGTGSGGGTRTGPSSGGPAPAGQGLAGGGKPPISTPATGATTSTPATGAATSAATRAEMAKAIAQSGTSTARAVALTARIQIYVKAYYALAHFLTLLSAIDDMQSMLANGTALPKEQRQADQVLSDSNLAKDEADQVTEDIDLVAWTVLAGETERANDDKSLFAIDEAASSLRDSLDHSAAVAQGLADDLKAAADPMLGEMYKQLLAVVSPNTSGTADNAIAFALYNSLEKLHNTTQSASQNYADTAATLTWWAEQFRGLGRWANDSAWAILRGRAWDRYLAEHPEARRDNP